MYAREKAVKELIAMTHTLASIVPKKARIWVLSVSKDAVRGRMVTRLRREVAELHSVLIVG